MENLGEDRRRTSPGGLWWLGASVLAALASAGCCLGPLVVAFLGIGGAWVSTLGRFEALRPFLLGAAFLGLGIAYVRLFRTGACSSAVDGSCGNSGQPRWARIVFWILAGVVVLAALFPWMMSLWS